jgi:hypothetical protein
MAFGYRKFEKPKARPEKKPTQMRKVGIKGKFWEFCLDIQNKFYLRIGMPQRCQKCDGTSHCGPLTPAHTRRRQDIRRGDFKFALRTVPLGAYCHFDVDKLGRVKAEPILEKLRKEALAKCGLTDRGADKILLEIALKLQAIDATKGENAKLQGFLVSADGETLCD